VKPEEQYSESFRAWITALANDVDVAPGDRGSPAWEHEIANQARRLGKKVVAGAVASSMIAKKTLTMIAENSLDCACGKCQPRTIEQVAELAAVALKAMDSKMVVDVVELGSLASNYLDSLQKTEASELN